MCDLLVLACHRGATAAVAGTARQTVINLLSFSPTIDAYVSSHIHPPLLFEKADWGIVV